MKRRILNIVILLIIICSFIPLFIPQPVYAATPWYNSGWGYRKQLTVTGSTAGAQTNYQKKFIINYGAGADSTELNQEPTTGTYAMDAGTGATTIVDAALTSAVNDYYVGCTFFNVTRMLSGTITAYVGATKTATTTSVAAQANGDTYYIVGRTATINLDSKSQVDFDDIRFTKTDGTTKLDAWLESYTASTTATIWVELDVLPVSPSTALFYVYYGNSSVTSDWSGTNTFIFFDDFERGVNTDVIGGSWTVGSGSATISTDQNYTALTSTGTAGTRSGKLAGHAATSSITIPRTAVSGYAIQLQSYKENATGAVIPIAHGNGTRRIATIINDTEDIRYYTGASVDTDTGFNTVADTWRKIEASNISWTGFTYHLYENGILIGNSLVMNNDAVATNVLAIYNIDATAGDDYYIDNIIIRNFCSPEPLVTAYGAIEIATIPLTINNAKVFTSYVETGDWLITVLYKNLYEPYYTNKENVKKYFVLQLLDNAGVVKAQVACPEWDYKPGSIYLNASQVTALTWGGVYHIRLTGLFTGVPYINYAIQSIDWVGNDLTRLDDWVVSSADLLGTYYSIGLTTPITFTTYVADRGKLLNTTGGVIFANGINGLTNKRPNIFQIYSQNTPHTIGGVTGAGAGETAATWQGMVGPYITAQLTNAGTVFGTDGKSIGAWILILVMIALMAFALPSGHVAPANVLALPIFFMGLGLRFFDWATGAVMIVLMLFLLWYNIWLKN